MHRFLIALIVGLCGVIDTATSCENLVGNQSELPSVQKAAFEKADQIANEIGTTAYQVIVDGHILRSYGDVGHASNIYSVRKSVLSIIFGIAVDLGTIDLEESIGEIGLEDKLGLSPEEKQAKVKHLLTATSCIFHPAAYETKEMHDRRPTRFSCLPGSRYYYNNWDFNALGAVLKKKMGRDFFDIFESELAQKLNFKDFFRSQHSRWVYEAASDHPAYELHLSARDMGKLGQLMLQRGKWCGAQLVSERWVKLSTKMHTTTHITGVGYGFMWWTAERDAQFGSRFLQGAYSARGNYGQVILVSPADSLVVVHKVDPRKSKRSVGTSDFGRLLKEILAGIRGH